MTYKFNNPLGGSQHFRDVMLGYALELEGMPNKLLMNKKWISTDMFFKDEIALPLVLWLTQVDGNMLLGEDLLPVTFKVNEQSLTGIGVTWGKKSNASLSSILMLTANSVQTLLSPLKVNPNFDYRNVILNIKDKVLLEGCSGTSLKVSNWHMNAHIRDSLINCPQIQPISNRHANEPNRK